MTKRKVDELDAAEASDEDPQPTSEQEHGESEQDEIPDEVTPPPQQKKRRGRPPGSKNKPKASTGAGTSTAADAPPPPKKKRGRPPKSDTQVRTPEELAAIEEKKNRPKGKRGRPPKKLKAEQAAAAAAAAAAKAEASGATNPTTAPTSAPAPLPRHRVTVLAGRVAVGGLVVTRFGTAAVPNKLIAYHRLASLANISNTGLAPGGKQS
ncbi:hypothetical protein RHS01_03047 [Rhizoctonia solani]|uniref:Uncharacterized protein n=1 Tax=Rhizoctonia solani TaxID=456999 RepID=A0A8H7IFW2_9AGAM|nr:hypothetical protein RHS01_03047 [Rhizoctonia solani]